MATLTVNGVSHTIVTAVSGEDGDPPLRLLPIALNRNGQPVRTQPTDWAFTIENTAIASPQADGTSLTLTVGAEGSTLAHGSSASANLTLPPLPVSVTPGVAISAVWTTTP